MKTLIVCATKYGSTLEIGRWIAERLPEEATVVRAEEMVSPEGYDLIFMGSGIYDNHRELPSLTKWIETFRDSLKGKKCVVFGVCLDLQGVYYKGKIHGGWNYILPLIKSLPEPPVHAGLLGGEINPKKLDERDRKALENFYKMIGRWQGEIPFKTKMDKEKVWQFAETAWNRAQGKKV